MGKEELGFLITNSNVYKTIDSNYFVNPNNGFFVMQILATENFQSDTLNSRGKILLQDLFDNFVCTSNNLLSLDDINLKLYIIESLSSSLKHILYSNGSRFTNKMVENFYSTSSTLFTNMKYLKENIEFNQSSFNNSEFQLLNTYQNNFRNLILNEFWRDYFKVLQNNDLYQELNEIENIHTLIYPHIDKCEKRDIIVNFHKKKTQFFDHVNYQSLFFKDLVENKQQQSQIMHLYFFLQMKKLKENTHFQYTHNILANDKNSEYDFQTNYNNPIYHIKYHSNNLRQEDVRNIFIYSYYMNNSKKCLIGFAFKDSDDYMKSFRKFLHL